LGLENDGPHLENRNSSIVFGGTGGSPD
jgi:hypothetical protein